MITSVRNVHMWWSKDFWKALGLAHLIKQFSELLASLLLLKSISDVCCAWNSIIIISVPYDLPNHLRQPAQHPDLQRRSRGEKTQSERTYPGYAYFTVGAKLVFLGRFPLSGGGKARLIRISVQNPFDYATFSSECTAPWGDCSAVASVDLLTLLVLL